MNIGDVHWIMMDNIIYKNTPGKGKKNVGVVGARDYDKGFTPEQLRGFGATWRRSTPRKQSASARTVRSSSTATAGRC